MGGSGSGQWYRYSSKETTNGVKSLDVNWLKREGYFMPGRWSSVQWSRGNTPTGNITIRAEENAILLEYRIRISGGDWESVSERVFISRTPCHYGNNRPWFVCPGVRNGIPCRRRVGKIYGASKYFLCRHCYDLAYDSQREPKRDRLLYKAQDIRRRLGGSPSLANSFPLKPKGMHWKTYLKLRRESEDAELRSWVMVADWLGINPLVSRPII